jgi:hypothetical protein
MKTKNLLLTVGIIAGAYYLLNKNSKPKNDASDGSESGGSAPGGGGGGGGFPLGYHPIIPAMSNPTPGPIEVVVVPIPPKPKPRNIENQIGSPIVEPDLMPKPNTNDTPAPSSTSPRPTINNQVETANP